MFPPTTSRTASYEKSAPSVAMGAIIQITAPMLDVASVRTAARLPRAACAATFGRIAIPIDEVTRASGTCKRVNA